MSEVKRYDSPTGIMDEKATGDYVEYSDYAALEAERDQLQVLAERFVRVANEQLVLWEDEDYGDRDRVSFWTEELAKARAALAGKGHSNMGMHDNNPDVSEPKMVDLDPEISRLLDKHWDELIGDETE